MNTSLLNEELAPLNAQIAETQQKLDELTASLRVIDADLQSHLAEKERFEALRDVCNALDHLNQLDAGDLFWAELPDVAAPDARLRTLRDQITAFEEQTAHVEEERNTLKAAIENCLWELGDLDEEVRQAYARDERRQEEFVIEREMSPAPFLPMVMPWNIDVSSERRFRKTLLISLSWCVLLGVILPMITLPVIDRSVEVVEIPERLVTLVKKEPIIPEPVPPQPQEEQKPVEPEKPKQETSEQTAKTEKPVKKVETVKKVAGGGKKDARKKAETTGVLAFKGTFTDLMDEVPVAKLGTEAKVKKNSKEIPGQSQARRNLVAMQAKSGTSGGISNFGVSRNLGNGGSGGGSGYGNAGQIGGVGFSRVESAVAGIGGEEGRPTAGGPGPGRTDEEIQIVFDRYKATLYRIYNKELRKDPTLRGKLLLKLTIEPEGEVSFCKVESTDLGSETLVAQIVDRVSRFNFGPKEDVPPTTILYPIDFLPAT
ncbi:MAG: AgmX/PglI C-terminal domain-containing protein [Desulfuromonadales bacterium]